VAPIASRKRERERWTLSCPECSHRIAWYGDDVMRRQWNGWKHGEFDRFDPWIEWVPGMPLGWGWLGKRSPVHWRPTPDGTVIDIGCFSCGWTALGVRYPEGLSDYMVSPDKARRT